MNEEGMYTFQGRKWLWKSEEGWGQVVIWQLWQRGTAAGSAFYSAKR